MGKLPRMGKPPYLKPHHVHEDDLAEILEEPYVRSAEDSKFGRERGYAVIRLIRTGDLFTWGFNTSTWDKLIDAFGDDSALWKGKRVKIHLATQNVRGEDRQVIYGMPYKEPQQQLDSQPKPLPIDVKALTSEQKQALMKELSTS